MIRIIVETCDAAMAANVGGSVHRTIKTFDIDLPELETFLREPETKALNFYHRQVVGIEVLTANQEGK